MTAGGDSVVHVRGCAFPVRFSYDVENHIWYEPLDTGEVRLGMTCVAGALASHRIFAFTPRRVGRDFGAGTSVATIESSKWVGPVRVAFDGVISEVNEPLSSNPTWLIDEPYDRGWMVIVRPKDDTALDGLTPGAEIGHRYSDWMNANDFPGCPAEPS